MRVAWTALLNLPSPLSQMALEDAAIDLDQIDRDRVGVLIGSGIGGIHTLEEQCRILIERGPGRISPFFVPSPMIPDMASGQVSIRFGLKGHNSCSVTACASGTHSLGDAYRIIAYGDADLMISGGSEAAVTALSLGGFAAAKALSVRNDEPKERPFDKERRLFAR